MMLTPRQKRQREDRERRNAEARALLPEPMSCEARKAIAEARMAQHDAELERRAEAA